MNNLGGGAWNAMKFDETKFPTVDQLKTAQVWKSEEEYKVAVWSWMCDDKDFLTQANANTLNTATGELCIMDVNTGDRTDKMHIGPLGPIMAGRTEAALVVCEVGVVEFWPGELAAIIHHCYKQRAGMRLAVWGTPDSIDKAVKGPVAELLAAGGELQGYKSRIIDLYMAKDDPLPDKNTWCTNVHSKVLLLSPGGFRNSPSYMVTQWSWTPSLLVHLIHILDVFRVAF